MQKLNLWWVFAISQTRFGSVWVPAAYVLAGLGPVFLEFLLLFLEQMEGQASFSPLL